MKKTFILAAGLVSLLFAGCSRDFGTFDSFMLKDPNFTDNDSKMHLNYTDALSAVSYDQGDKISVNGTEFTIVKDGSTWKATSSTPVEAEHFYAAYCDGTVDNFSSSTFRFDISSNLATTNGIVLAGQTDDYNMTLTPACAILRVNLETPGYTVRVGFESSKIPMTGQINAATGRITNAFSYLAKVQQVGSGYTGDFLTMKEDASHNYYIGIPIVNNSVSTYLYLEWSDGVTTTRYRTSGHVMLQPGYVYTVGGSRVSPFSIDGVGIGVFVVNGTGVSFSRGNLMFNPSNKKFFIADNQYNTVGYNNDNITAGAWYGQNLDLFGWGTSGYSNYNPWLYTDDASSYYSGGNLVGSGYNYDWGSKSRWPIYRNSNKQDVSNASWRTLTSAEWSSLFSSPLHKWGMCHITISGTVYKGVALCPYLVDKNGSYEEWTCPTGITFNTGAASNFNTNAFSESDWNTLENSGVIFLPVTGYRYIDGTEDYTTYGWYWSSTKATGDDAYGMMFGHYGSTDQPNVQTVPRYMGCAVRLVTTVE